MTPQPRTCTICQQDKPATAFRSRGRQCRECRTKQQLALEHRTREWAAGVSRVCRGCKAEKPLTEYYVAKGEPDSICKTCRKAHQRATYAIRKEHRGQPVFIPPPTPPQVLLGYDCRGCGFTHLTPPERCWKCSGGSFEPVYQAT